MIWLPLKNAAITTTYALLQNKSVVVYEEMLRVIINYCTHTRQQFSAILNWLSSALWSRCSANTSSYKVASIISHKQRGERFRIFSYPGATRQMKGSVSFAPSLMQWHSYHLTDVPEALASLGDNAPDGTEGLVEYFTTNCLNDTFRRVQTTGEDGAISISMRRSKPRMKTDN